MQELLLMGLGECIKDIKVPWQCCECIYWVPGRGDHKLNIFSYHDEITSCYRGGKLNVLAG